MVLLLNINRCQHCRLGRESLGLFCRTLPQESCFDLEFRTISHRKAVSLRRSEWVWKSLIFGFWIHSETSKLIRGSECNLQCTALLSIRSTVDYNGHTIGRCKDNPGMPRRAVQQSGKLHASDASFHSDVLQFSSLESRSQRSLFSTILPKFHSLMIQLPFSFEVPFEVSAQVNAAQMEFDPNAID